jgi:hypothetical protein
MADPKQDLDEFLKGPSRKSVPCQTCFHYPHLLEEMRHYMRRRDASLPPGKRTRKSFTQFHEWLQRNREYTLEVTTFRKHMSRCEPELYGRAAKR